MRHGTCLLFCAYFTVESAFGGASVRRSAWDGEVPGGSRDTGGGCVFIDFSHALPTETANASRLHAEHVSALRRTIAPARVEAVLFKPSRGPWEKPERGGHCTLEAETFRETLVPHARRARGPPWLPRPPSFHVYSHDIHQGKHSCVT